MRRALVATVVLSALALSCQLLLGIRDSDFTVDEAEAGPKVDAPAAPSVTSCSAPLPARPAGGGGGGDAGVYLLALQSVVLGGGGPAGFDLDSACTCSLQPGIEARPTCSPPDGSAPRAECDLDGGVDNALLPLANGFAKDAVARLNRGIGKQFACGRKNVLFVLQEYNGLADDDEVLFQGVESFGIREPREEDPDAGECGPTWPAKFDGNDRWHVDPKLAAQNGAPLLPSFKGYVSNWQLVVDGRLPGQPSEPFSIVGLGSSPLGMKGVVIVAKLEPSDGGVLLKDGIAAGRTNANEALAAFGSQEDEDNPGARSCVAATWGFIRQTLCRSLDVATDPRRDLLNEPCDALSFVVGFTASPATIVRSAPVPTPDIDAGPCDPALLHCQ